MIRPPTDKVPIKIEVLADSEDGQLRKLEDSFLKEIGEQTLTEEKQKQLVEAISDGRITFFFAKRGYRAIGMCSVVKCFSTFTCTDTGVFEDFYVEPAFRNKGIARMLGHAAQEWSHEQELSSLTVCCASCDEEMYRHLGFDILLGKTYACTPLTPNSTRLSPIFAHTYSYRVIVLNSQSKPKKHRDYHTISVLFSCIEIAAFAGDWIAR